MKGLEHVHLLIERDTNTRIPTCVPFYEVAILEEIHNKGEDVRVYEVSREMFPVESFDVDEAYAQLQRKYKVPAMEPALAAVYRDKRVLARAVGELPELEVKRAKKKEEVVREVA